MTGLVAFRVHYRPGTGRYQPPRLLANGGDILKMLGYLGEQVLRILEIPNSVTGSVMFFVLFPAFHHLVTPPKTPFFPNRSRSDCWGMGRGF